MMPIISICIPTYNRAKYLRNTLDSIVRQDDFGKIQIIISDNCSTDDTFDVAAGYVERFPLNIRYRRNDKNINDANFVKALSLGDGCFLKLHNDTAILKDGALRKMISAVISGRAQGYTPFFMNGNGNSEGLIENLGDFIDRTKYWNTWIGAFGIWKKDFESVRKIMIEKSDTKLAQSWAWFSLVSKGLPVFVDNEILFDVAVVSKKGGYNVAQVFGMNYNHILEHFYLLGSLPISIHKTAKRDILDFVNKYYFDVRDRFSFEKSGYFKWMLPVYWRNYYFYIKLIGVFNSLLKSRMRMVYNCFDSIG